MIKRKIKYLLLLSVIFSLFLTCSAIAAEDGAETTLSDMIIEDGVLISYTGNEEVVTIPDGVTKIGSKVFLYNQTIKKVILPEGIVEIGKEAFLGSSLEEINFPESLRSVGDYAFSGSALEIVEASEDFEFECGRMAFEGCSQYYENDGFFIIGNVLADGNAVHPKDGILVIPEGITIIAPFAFSNNLVGIKEVVLPNGLKIIGAAAFHSMVSLRNIHFPEELEYIGDGAFARTGLNDITIPFGVTYIGENAFIDERNSVLTFRGKTGSAAQNYAKENGHTFYATNMDDFQIEDNILIKYLGTDTEVTIPDGVTKVADSAFADNTTITSVTIPEGVILLGEKAFWNCTSLVEVSLPDSLTDIGYAVFDGCKSLERLTLPVGIQELEKCIFTDNNGNYNQSYIRELTIHSPDFQFEGEVPAWILCLTNLETVYGYTGSDAETIAVENKAIFVPLEESVRDISVNYSNTLSYVGDVNEDGLVGANDALAILQHVVKLKELPLPERGDVDGVEGISAVDALQVLRYVVELEERVVRKPEAFETYQFSANGRFQGLSDEVINETKIVESKEELSAFVESVYEQYCIPTNEKDFETAKAYFDMLDEAYFKENVCVVMVDTGKLGFGRYKANALLNLDSYVEGEKVHKRGLRLDYYLGTDTPVSSVSKEGAYILISSTTVPIESLNGAILEEVVIKTVGEEQ